MPPERGRDRREQRLRFGRRERRRQTAQELEVVPVPDPPGRIADLGRGRIPAHAFPVDRAFEVDEQAGNGERAEQTASRRARPVRPTIRGKTGIKKKTSSGTTSVK